MNKCFLKGKGIIERDKTKGKLSGLFTLEEGDENQKVELEIINCNFEFINSIRSEE